MTITTRHHPAVSALLQRQQNGGTVTREDWARAIAAWATQAMTAQQWEEWAASGGFTWAQLDELAAAIRELGLQPREIMPELHWVMVLMYAHDRNLQMKDYLRLVERHRLFIDDEHVADYEQYGMGDDGGVDRDNPLATHIHVIGTRAPYHLSEQHYMWLLREENEEGQHWLQPPYRSYRDALTAARARARELDGTQLC
jgi:hypothetical protein